MNIKEIKQSEALSFKDLDNGLKNKFRYDWLDLVVSVQTKTQGVVKVKVSDSIVNVDVPGKVQCKYCKDLVAYHSRGKSSIENHIKSKKHASKVEDRLTNQTLSSSLTAPKKPEVFSIFKKKPTNDPSVQSSLSITDSTDSSSSDPIITHSQAEPEQPKSDVKPIIPTSDRTANMEAMILACVAENNWSFNVVPRLVNLIKCCSTDPVALSKVKLDDVTAAYKLRFGVNHYFTQTLVAHLQQSPFSFNIDEATASNNNKKVLSVLVSYFNSDRNQIVTEHFASIELIKCDAANIFHAVKDLIEDNKIPWKNLQSCLLDSCSVMRGSKSGFETRLRECAPHLLDINGDSCHHVHNTAKKFCEPFDNYVEKLFSDLHTDFKWSSESKAFLMELCDLFDVKFTMPERFVSHRWLSSYDVAMSTLRLYDIYHLYFSSLVSDIDTKRSISEFVSRLKNPAVEKKVYDILALIKEKAKTSTKDGKERKERIKAKLFSSNAWTQLLLNLYVSVMGMLKSYVLLFQGKDPLIHKLHDNQMSVAKKLCACFIKSQHLSDSPQTLESLDLDNVDYHLPLESCYIGKQTSTILNACSQSQRRDFLIKVNKCYRQAAKHILRTFPLTNPLLQQLSAIDPAVPNHSTITTSLISLSHHSSHFLTLPEQEAVLVEIKDYTASSHSYNGTDRADVWWTSQNSFPTLQKLALTCLTIFHGPQVEGSFSSMKDIMKTKSSSMQVVTFSALQSVKYALKARGATATSFFYRKDIKHTPVDGFLVQSIKGAAGKHKKNLVLLKEQREQKKKMLNMRLQTLKDKNMSKSIREKAIRHALNKHIRNSKKSQKLPVGEKRSTKPPAKRQKC